MNVLGLHAHFYYLHFWETFAKKKYSNSFCARALRVPITCSLSTLDSSLCHCPISAYSFQVCICMYYHISTAVSCHRNTKYSSLQIMVSLGCLVKRKKQIHLKNSSVKMPHKKIQLRCSELSPWEEYPLTTERAYWN